MKIPTRVFLVGIYELNSISLDIKKGECHPWSVKKILVENGSMNYWRLLFFFISDNTGVRELAPYPTDKKDKSSRNGRKKIV